MFSEKKKHPQINFLAKCTNRKIIKKKKKKKTDGTRSQIFATTSKNNNEAASFQLSLFFPRYSVLYLYYAD